MTAYRLYYFDGLGRVAAARDLESETDAAAIQMAARHANGQAMELWRQDQFVQCLRTRPAESRFALPG